MKSSLKTITGKVITFMICVISTCILLTSILSAFLMIQFDYYTNDRDKVYENIVYNQISSDVYHNARYVAQNYQDEIMDVYNDELVIQIFDLDGILLAQSEDADKVTKWNYSVVCSICDDWQEFDYDSSSDNPIDVDFKTSDYIIKANIKENNISYYTVARNVLDVTYSLKYWIYVFISLSAIVMIISFIILMCVSARRNQDDEIHPGILNKIPFDMLLFISAIAFIGYIYLLDSADETSVTLILLFFGMIIFTSIFLGLCMSFASRVKQQNLIKNSFIYIVCVLIVKALKYCGRFVINIIKKLFVSIRYLFNNIPLIYKTIILFVLICLFELLFFFTNDDGAVFWLIEKLILLPFIMFVAISLRKLQKGGYALAQGDMSYHVDTQKMIWDFKTHGENLNNISKGMAIAINEQMKSERMRTELITNVSHDIKTPLTSIINYSDLISKEKTTNKNIREYTKVLSKQSERLKRLIDDLVEASKASTGNLEVDLMVCDAATFVLQAAGEYEDKMKKADLTLITDISDQEINIMADSRRMLRIFDNLMNNILKYALKNTRVYLSLEKIDNNAIFTFKNTSSQQLNISEEELMERFTRGDESRNTEGNGLGLAIAKSLAQLQNGQLKIEIDGDLFKAILSFPII